MIPHFQFVFLLSEQPLLQVHLQNLTTRHTLPSLFFKVFGLHGLAVILRIQLLGLSLPLPLLNLGFGPEGMHGQDHLPQVVDITFQFEVVLGFK